MAWVDIRKAYDSVDHSWLQEMFVLHCFPKWTGNVVSRLSAKWNTRINVKTKQGVEIMYQVQQRAPTGGRIMPSFIYFMSEPGSMETARK